MIARRIVLTAIALAMWAGIAASQPYTNRPVKILVPYSVGTGNDILARFIGQKLGEMWGTTFVVENRPGASGNIGTAAVAQAVPDGTTLLLTPNNFVVSPYVYKNAQYDPLKDFAPVALLGWGRLLLVAHPGTGFKSLGDMLAAVRARPGKLTYASPGAGTPHQVSMELFKVLAGVDILHVPYKSSGPAVIDLLGGEVNLMFLPIHVAQPYIKDGRLRVLGIGSARRAAVLPEVPTLAEQGLKGAEVDIWYAMYAPARTPADIISKLNSGINAVLSSPENKAALAKQGLETSPGSVMELATLTTDDAARWKEIARRANLSVD